jgi:hypothetical protein
VTTRCTRDGEPEYRIQERATGCWDTILQIWMTVTQQTSEQTAFHFPHKKQVEVVWCAKHEIEPTQQATCNQPPRLTLQQTSSLCHVTMVTQTAKSFRLRKPSSNLVIYFCSMFIQFYQHLQHNTRYSTYLLFISNDVYSHISWKPLAFLADNLADLFSKLACIYFLREIR